MTKTYLESMIIMTGLFAAAITASKVSATVKRFFNDKEIQIMTKNPRPTLSLNATPKLVFNEVDGANSYRVKIELEEPSNVLWEIELPHPDFVDRFYEFGYPSGKPPLTPLVSYLLIAEANDNKGKCLKKFQTKVIFLEKNAQQSVQEFQALLDIQGSKDLINKWKETKEAISAHCDEGTPWPTQRDDSSFVSRLIISFH